MMVKIIHAPQADSDWIRMSVFSFKAHTNHPKEYTGKGVTSAETASIAELTLGHAGAAASGTAKQLTMNRGFEGAPLVSRQIRNVQAMHKGCVQRVHVSMLQLQVASIVRIQLEGTPESRGRSKDLPAPTSFEGDDTLYMQFMKSFKSGPGSGSTLGALRQVVEKINRGVPEKERVVELTVDNTVSPPAWCLVISSVSRLRVACDAWEHPYWERSSMAIDSTHMSSVEELKSHTAQVRDLEDNATLLAVGLSSGETTQTANWFKASLTKMVRRSCNSRYTMKNTFCVQDGSQAYRSSSIEYDQYTLDDPWHMFRSIFASLPKVRRTESDQLSATEQAAQR
jgi:hypothetical protein